MKKIISLLLVLAMCFGLCACGKSQAVKNAEELIAGLAFVDEKSGAEIIEAINAYSALSQEDKEKVENYDILVEAKDTYLKIKYREAYELIDAASAITIDGMYDIYAAWYFGIYEATKGYSDKTGFFFDFAYAIYSRGRNPFLQKDLEAAAQSLGYSHTDVRSDWQKCVSVMLVATAAKGYYSKIDAKLEAADEIISEMNKISPDSQYTINIKAYYMTLADYAEMYEEPSGSLLDLADAMKSYEKELKEYGDTVRLDLKW